MNIITGISRKSGVRSPESEVPRFDAFGIFGTTRNPQPAPRNSQLLILALLFLTMIFGACASHQPAEEDEVSVKSDVKVTSPVLLPASEKVVFMAVTRYMQNNDIRTQVTGLVRKINCSVASTIAPGQPLFVIQPQEAAALQRSKLVNSLTNALSDTVYAHLSGQVKNLNVQVGDFVQVGDILATCIRANSMRIIAYIPVEKAAKMASLKKCSVILPDGSVIAGEIAGKLPAAESQDQTEAYIIEPAKPLMLAENINLTVQFTPEKLQDVLFVPENAVLGNEEQTQFWVLKLMNDSTCIKVPVEKGLEQDSLIQVITNNLTIGDKVVTEGGYGLADSARVQVINK